MEHSGWLACLPLEHLAGRSLHKADLFPPTKPNIYRVFIKSGQVTAQRMAGSIISRCLEVAPDLPCSPQEPVPKGPSLGWDIHPKMV